MNRRQLLILDDDKIQHLFLQKRLSIIDPYSDLHCFDSPLLAIDFLKKNPIDVIFLDLHLPEMDGWQIIGELKKIGTKGRVFVLSGSVDPNDKNRIAHDPFIHGHFEKPLSQHDLESMLAQ